MRFALRARTRTKTLSIADPVAILPPVSIQSPAFCRTGNLSNASIGISSLRSLFLAAIAARNRTQAFLFIEGSNNFLEAINKNARARRAFLLIWRRERDSNPRYAINVYTLSRRAPSAAQPPLRNLIFNTTRVLVYFFNSYRRNFFYSACALLVSS